MTEAGHGSALRRLVAALERGGSITRDGGKTYTCPAHEDSNPSLSVAQGDRGAVIHCHRGCEPDDVIDALGLESRDLFDEPRKTAKSPRVVARYDYTDESGQLLYQVERLEPKSFRQRRPDGKGGWVYKLGDVPRVLYRLPEVIAAVGAGDTVFICEGEKDCDAMRAAGQVATCNSGGAGKWPVEFAAYFRDADVTAVADRDEPGRKHAGDVDASLAGVARSVRIVEAREGKDAADHLEAGYSVDEFVDAREAPPATGIPLLTPEEFATDDVPNAIVETLIYEASTHTYNGATKAGKTKSTTQLAICVATGVSFLGLAVRKARVLYLSLELSAGMVRRGMERIAAATGLRMPVIDSELFIAAPTRGRSLSVNLGTDEGRRALAATIRATGAELVILDTLYRFIPGLDPSANADMGPVFGWFNQLTQETGAALVSLDHTAKGEGFGPVSQSGIGAQVKGGATAVVLSLKRTTREDGGRWQLDCESWFGSWDEPIYFERPRLPSGERGDGCVRCGAVEGYSLSREKLEDLFRKFGELDDDGQPGFTSTRKLSEALKLAGYASGNDQAETIVGAIRREHSTTPGARYGFDRPITTLTRGNGKTSPTEWRWRHDPQPPPGDLE